MIDIRCITRILDKTTVVENAINGCKVPCTVQFQSRNIFVAQTMKPRIWSVISMEIYHTFFMKTYTQNFNLCNLLQELFDKITIETNKQLFL